MTEGQSLMKNYLEMAKTLRSKFIVLPLFVASCLSPQSYVEAPYVESPQVSSLNQLYIDKSFFTFVLTDTSTFGTSAGCGFIADHAIYTAKHLLKDSSMRRRYSLSFLHDVAIMGTTLVKGLEICTEAHRDGDQLYYRVRGTNIDLTICSIGMYKYNVEASSTMKPGDSGSPVFCMKHNRVVGLVSAYWPEDPSFPRNGGTLGVIAAIRPNEFEPIGYPKR